MNEHVPVFRNICFYHAFQICFWSNSYIVKLIARTTDRHGEYYRSKVINDAVCSKRLVVLCTTQYTQCTLLKRLDRLNVIAGKSFHYSLSLDERR